MSIMLLQNLTVYMVTFWKRNTSRRNDVHNCAAWSLEDLINKVITEVNLSQSSANEML